MDMLSEVKLKELVETDMYIFYVILYIKYII